MLLQRCYSVVIIFPRIINQKLNFSKPIYKIVVQVKSKLGLFLSKKSTKALFFIGFFNGFLPCGLVYMAVIGAVSTGNSTQGALYMILFGLGTIPMLTAAVFLGNFVNLSLRSKIQKAIPVFVVIIGLLFVLRGLGLGIPYISPSDANLQLSNNPADCITIEKNE